MSCTVHKNKIHMDIARISSPAKWATPGTSGPSELYFTHRIFFTIKWSTPSNKPQVQKRTLFVVVAVAAFSSEGVSIWKFSPSQTPSVFRHCIQRRCKITEKKSLFSAKASVTVVPQRPYCTKFEPPQGLNISNALLISSISMHLCVCVCLSVCVYMSMCVCLCVTNISRHISKQFSSVWAARTPSRRRHRNDCMWFWGRSPGSPSPRGSGKRRWTPTSRWRLCNQHFD